MDEKEKLRLEKVYSKMPDTELGEMLLCDQSGYAEGVYDLVSAEAKKRGLDKTKMNEIIEKKKSELPFSWGKFIIAVGFFYGSIALIFGGIFGILTEYFPNRIFSIIIGGLSLIYAYGLMKRKRWGLNIVLFLFYITIPICILEFILGISNVNTMFTIQGIGGGIAAFLNIIYFRKRKFMFTSGEASQTSASVDE
jgi:vacuolar-type H+-ATPase subunit I/STV1